MKIINFYLLFIFVVLCGCKKHDIASVVVPDATYAGSFSLSGTLIYPLTPGNVTLVMKAGTYSCTSPSTNFGAGARGSFTVSGQQIIFRDSTVHTANFDGNIILNGTYNATARNDSLLLVRTINNINYNYQLKRQ